MLREGQIQGGKHRRQRNGAERKFKLNILGQEMVPYLENLCQLNLLVVKDCMDTVNSLLGLMRRSPLGFLMQDGNQSPDGHVTNDIRRQIKAISLRCGKL